MFAVSNPKAEYYDGSTRIDQFVRKEEALPEVIHEGHRNETLSKYAGKVITRLGDTKKAREAFDKAADKCCPPLDSEELNTIWRSAQSFFHTTVETSKGYVEPDDYDEAGGHNKKPKGFTVDDMKYVIKQLGITVRYNETVRIKEMTGLPTANSDSNADTTLESLIWGYMGRHGFSCSSRIFDAHLATIFDQNRYNPIKEMLDNTKWDGQDRIAELCYQIIGASDREAVYIRKWLHQCIALGLNDEKKPYNAEGVLVIQGAQGIGKTKLFAKLAVKREWFFDGASIDMSNKDTIIQATSCWITELGELDSTLKREQSALKGFLTSPQDKYRMPYARTSSTHPRRTSFCGTVNPEEFLNDETGSRRFWVVSGKNLSLERIVAIDEDWAKQLWKQVYETLYLPAPGQFFLTQEESMAMQTANEAFTKMLPGEIEVLDKLDFDSPKSSWRWWTVSELTEALNAKGVNSMHIGKVAAKLERTDKRVEKKNKHGKKEYCLPKLYDPYISTSAGTSGTSTGGLNAGGTGTGSNADDEPLCPED